MTTSLKKAIDDVGGPEAAAKVCGKTTRAIYKWLQKGTLPRTEYTGETVYAHLLADASCGKFTAQWLLDNASPNSTQAA